MPNLLLTRVMIESGLNEAGKHFLPDYIWEDIWNREQLKWDHEQFEYDQKFERTR